MTLHIFNPGHDDALADGTPYYTHTRIARVMSASLSALPRLWAKEGDVVCAADGLHQFSDWQRVERISPWGWDAALVHQLRKDGAPECLLPTKEHIDMLRALSSRETSVRLLAMIDKPTGLTSRLARSWQEVCAFARCYGRVLAKAPWSCSGRGLVVLDASPTEPQRRRVENILRRQGGVAVEPFLDRVADFAMEFWAERNGAVRYEGLSLFHTDSQGHYLDNFVADECTLLSLLSPFPFEHTREQVRRALEQLLANHYEGPIGVDMLQYRTPHGIFTHPCVEVNLRHTMGMAALSLQKRIPSSVRVARFQIGRSQAMPRQAHLLCGHGHELAAWWVNEND